MRASPKTCASTLSFKVEPGLVSHPHSRYGMQTDHWIGGEPGKYRVVTDYKDNFEGVMIEHAGVSFSRCTINKDWIVFGTWLGRIYIRDCLEFSVLNIWCSVRGLVLLLSATEVDLHLQYWTYISMFLTSHTVGRGTLHSSMLWTLVRVIVPSHTEWGETAELRGYCPSWGGLCQLKYVPAEYSTGLITPSICRPKAVNTVQRAYVYRRTIQPGR